jgi:hypothetical protein
MKALLLIVTTCSLLINCGGSSTSNEDFVEIDADVQQFPSILMVINRDAFRYDECKLTINDDYETGTFGVDSKEHYVIPYAKLVDDDDNRFNPVSKAITKVELYCKDVQGKRGLISVEK